MLQDSTVDRCRNRAGQGRRCRFGVAVIAEGRRDTLAVQPKELCDLAPQSLIATDGG